MYFRKASSPHDPNSRKFGESEGKLYQLLTQEWQLVYVDDGSVKCKRDLISSCAKLQATNLTSPAHHAKYH